MHDIKGLPKNTRAMAPLGDVLYPGIVAEPQAEEPLGEGMIRVEFTRPVKAEPPSPGWLAATPPGSDDGTRFETLAARGPNPAAAEALSPR